MNLPVSVDHAQLPQTYEAARQALVQCDQIDECKDWADKAAALASYAKQADDPTLMEMAIRIQTRATRRVGQLLEQIPKGSGRPEKIKAGGDLNLSNGGDQNIKDGGGPNVLSRKEASSQAGLSERQAKAALRVARVPQEEFDAQVEGSNPPTVTKLAEQGTQKRNIVNLGDRTEAQYNSALHFTAELKEAFEMLRDLKLSAIPHLTHRQARDCIKYLSGIHTIVQNLKGKFSHEQSAHNDRSQSSSKVA